MLTNVVQREDTWSSGQTGVWDPKSKCLNSESNIYEQCNFSLEKWIKIKNQRCLKAVEENTS